MRRLTILAVAIAAVAAFAFYRSGNEEAVSSANARPIVSVTVPELSARAKAGEAAFNRNCAACHGPDGAGLEGIGPPFVHKVYEPGHHGDGAFFAAAKGGVRAHHWPFGNMPPVEGIADATIADIVVYVRELQRANGID